MKIEYEIIHPDEGSSLKLLHTRTMAEEYPWKYHYHPELELICVIHSSGTRHVGNHFSNYEDGDVVFIGSNLPHAGFGLNAHGFHEEIVLQVREEVIRQSILSRPEMSVIHGLLENARYGISFKGETKKMIMERCAKLPALSKFERFVEMILILQLLASSTEFELLNPTTVLSSLIKKNNIRLQQIFNHIEKHFQEEIDVKDIAALANLSLPSFCNYFKKIMNTTFTDFLNQYRIQRACFLLQQEKTISEISFACGFNNVAYFNKVFKTIIGKTPTEFKKEKLKQAMK